MIKEKADFHSIFLKEGDILYTNIYSLDKDKFNNWVVNNFEKVKTIASYEEVIPTKETMNKIIKKGYDHRSSQCHYSSKAVSLIDESFEYWTGFVHQQDFLFNIITHSFNILDGILVDFSKINEKCEIIDKGKEGFPRTYYGIKIPTGFIRKFEYETLNNHSMKPHLFEWYKEMKSH